MSNRVAVLSRDCVTPNGGTLTTRQSSLVVDADPPRECGARGITTLRREIHCTLPMGHDGEHANYTGTFSEHLRRLHERPDLVSATDEQAESRRRLGR